MKRRRRALIGCLTASRPCRTEKEKKKKLMADLTPFRVLRNGDKMATLVLDNGAYSAKIGFSQEKGYLVNWDVQEGLGSSVWERDESMNEILFEEYQFQSVLRTNGESSSRNTLPVHSALFHN
ncbi:hypothetical protein F7725_023497 [Dissostichus mawsoni]|uniref:Uncharacterized protein n=1 Tax=Dissostichus mawsoni TaxID=36200 RepID=A0A7J5Z0V4_DISMA|nr:hypothetical protein F7725_023497 [Dissostichus mawsoni]